MCSALETAQQKDELGVYSDHLVQHLNCTRERAKPFPEQENYIKRRYDDGFIVPGKGNLF